MIKNNQNNSNYSYNLNIYIFFRTLFPSHLILNKIKILRTLTFPPVISQKTNHNQNSRKTP